MATIKDVAVLAGVSIGTVDRVLNDRGRVAPETLRRVRHAISELDYTPNLTARHLSKAKTYTFGVMMPHEGQDCGYWELPRSGIARAARDLAFHNVHARHFNFNRHSSASFEECCRHVRESDLDGLVLAPVLSHPAERFLAAIHNEKGIPAVLFDSHVEAGGRFTFVGQDPFNSGLVAGKLLKILRRRGTICAVVTVGTDDYHLARRGEGFCHFFRDDPTVNIRSIELVPREERDLAGELRRFLAPVMEDLSGVFVTNALSHFVVEYLETGGPSHHVPLVTYDLIPQNVEYLRRGIIDFVISQEPETQGYQAMYELYRQVVLGREAVEVIAMPIELVTGENLDSYLQARHTVS